MKALCVMNLYHLYLPDTRTWSTKLYTLFQLLHFKLPQHTRLRCAGSGKELTLAQLMKQGGCALFTPAVPRGSVAPPAVETVPHPPSPIPSVPPAAARPQPFARPVTDDAELCRLQKIACWLFISLTVLFLSVLFTVAAVTALSVFMQSSLSVSTLLTAAAIGLIPGICALVVLLKE